MTQEDGQSVSNPAQEVPGADAGAAPTPARNEISAASAAADDERGRSYQQQIEQALNKESGRLGDVWKLREKNPQEIAEELSVRTPGFVYSNRRIIDALVDGVRPTKPTPAQQVASAVRAFAARHKNSLRGRAVSRLENLAEACEQVAQDPRAIQQEDSDDDARTQEAERSDTPGIYVYTYPHYRRHPVLPGVSYDGTGSKTQPRTYFKIGMSGRGVKERIKDQMRGTAAPERPSLERIYTASPESDLKTLEKRLHTHLHCADHGRERSCGHGTEWFLTHLKFVDDTALLLSLDARYKREEEPGEGSTT